MYASSHLQVKRIPYRIHPINSVLEDSLAVVAGVMFFGWMRLPPR